MSTNADDHPEPRDYLSPDWPYRRQAWVMQRMHRNGWSIEGLARVFGLTPAGVESYLAKDTRADLAPASQDRKSAKNDDGTLAT